MTLMGTLVATSLSGREQARLTTSKTLALLGEAMSFPLCSEVPALTQQADLASYRYETKVWLSRWAKINTNNDIATQHKAKISTSTSKTPPIPAPITLTPWTARDDFVVRLRAVARNFQADILIYLHKVLPEIPADEDVDEDDIMYLQASTAADMLAAIIVFHFESSLAMLHSSSWCRRLIRNASSSLLNRLAGLIASTKRHIKNSAGKHLNRDRAEHLLCELDDAFSSFEVMMHFESMHQICLGVVQQSQVSFAASLNLVQQMTSDTAGKENDTSSKTKSSSSTGPEEALSAIVDFFSSGRDIVDRLVTFLEGPRFTLEEDDTATYAPWLDGVAFLCERFADSLLELTNAVASRHFDVLMPLIGGLWVHGKALCDMLGANEGFFGETGTNAAGMVLTGRQIAYMCVRRLQTSMNALKGVLDATESSSMY